MPCSVPICLSLFFSREKESYYTGVSVWLYLTAVQSVFSAVLSAWGKWRERASGRDRYRAQMGECVSSGSVQHQLCRSAFLVWSARHFCWMCLCGELLFTSFFHFKGLNRERNLFKACFHMTHTGTHKHTLKSRDIFLLGNLSINQCDFKHIPQATRLTW